MNAFRSKRSDPNRGQLPFSSQPISSTLPELPQASDFRASLILTDLSKRFSVLRSPTGEPATVQDLKSKFAQQRARGAQNQITEEEEVMLLETLGRMRTRTGPLSGKSQDNVNELVEQHSIKSMSTTNSVLHASVTSSPSGRSTKRYSNNLFGSGRFRDYPYFKNAGTVHGRTGSTPARAPSITPTETSISIHEVASLPDSVQPIISDTSSIQSSTGNGVTNAPNPFATSDSQLPIPDAPLLKRASMALADAIKELEEETEDEVVMPRLSRPSPDLNSRQAEGIVELAKSSQSSLHYPTVIEAGTAISSDRQAYHERRTSPVFSRTLPGYVPGMPRPMTPRDVEPEDQRSHSATPRAASPLPSNIADSSSSSMPSNLLTALNGLESVSPALHQSSRPTSPSTSVLRPTTPSRSTPLFLQRSPSGRRTPENGTLGGDAVNFDSPLNSSVMLKRRPVSPSGGHTYQSMTVSSRPSTPSNVIWNVGAAEANQKSHSHERNGSWPSDAGIGNGHSPGFHDSRPKHPTLATLPDSPLLDLVFGTDASLTTTNRVPRSATPTYGLPRPPGFTNMDTSPHNGNGSKRSSRQNASSPFHFDNFPPLVLLPVVSSSRSSLESTGSSYHSWEGEKERFMSIFLDADAQQPAWHDLSVDRTNSFVSADEDEWDPEEIIGRYAGLKKSDLKAMQEKLVSLSVARDDARERAPSIRRRRPSTSQSNYSTNGRERVASPPPTSPITAMEHHLKTTAVLNAMADSIQSKQPEMIDTSVQRVPDVEPSPNTRRHRDLAQALFGDDMEREREQTPKPVSQQTSESSTLEHRKALTTDEPQKSNERVPMTSSSPSQPELKANDTLQEVDLVREVQQKAEAATLALRRTPQSSEQRLERSAQGSIRRRINPNQISEPQLVSASTSVDTIPIRPPPHVNPGTSKIGSRFRKLRGTLRAKNPPPVGDESYTQAEINSPPSSQDISYDASKLKSPSGTLNIVDNGRVKNPIASPPASTGPGLKGFMARFRSKKATNNTPLDRRGPHVSPSVISLATSHGERAVATQINSNDSAAPSSVSSIQQTLDHSQSALSCRDTAVTPDSNELALRQLFDAASNLGVDQNALNALLARTPSLSKNRQTQERGARPSMDKVIESANETTEQNSIIVAPVEDELTPSQSLTIPVSNLGQNSPNGVLVHKTEDSRRPQDGLSANVIVRRTIIYPSNSRASPIPLEINSLVRKNSRRRRTSVLSTSSRSVQDRVPTPPPPKSPTSKSFSNGLSPPVPQIPRSLLPNSEPPKVPQSPTSHSFEKSSSAYDSFYDMYSEDNNTAAGNDQLASTRQPNTSSDAPAIEFIELANGETIWSIVNGLRDGDDESMYASRTSFTSELSAHDGNSDNVQVYAKDHKRNGSKGSASSFTSRRRLLHGKARPETKVYYSSSAQIGQMIESLSQGMDTGSSVNGPKPGHSASSSLSLPPPTNGAHWTVEERLDQMLNSIRND